MFNVKATCPSCGDVHLPPQHLRIGWDERNYYFLCPKCNDLVVKPTSDEVLALLRSVTVVTDQPVDQELLDPVRQSGMGVPTAEDIINFMCELDIELPLLRLEMDMA